MILYNVRKNGPYEYDKFILNIYQIINDVRNKQVETKKSLADNQEKINNIDTAYTKIQEDLNKIQTLMRTYFY